MRVIVTDHEVFFNGARRKQGSEFELDVRFLPLDRDGTPALPGGLWDAKDASTAHKMIAENQSRSYRAAVESAGKAAEIKIINPGDSRHYRT